jgi:hypothetical protein
VQGSSASRSRYIVLERQARDVARNQKEEQNRPVVSVTERVETMHGACWRAAVPWFRNKMCERERERDQLTSNRIGVLRTMMQETRTRDCGSSFPRVFQNLGAGMLAQHQSCQPQARMPTSPVVVFSPVKPGQVVKNQYSWTPMRILVYFTGCRKPRFERRTRLGPQRTNLRLPHRRGSRNVTYAWRPCTIGLCENPTRRVHTCGVD